jgi:hypothetical protein
LHTEQRRMWSRHLQLLQHSLKCSDVRRHFKRAPYCVPDSWDNRQKSTHSDSESGLHLCTTVNEFSPGLMWCVAVQTEHSLSSTRMTLVWEKWAYWASCCWSTKRTESTSTATKQRQQHTHCREWGPCELSASDTYLYDTYIVVVVVDVLLLSLSYKSQCWHIQSRKVSHTKLWVKKLKKKEKKEVVHEVRRFITHFTDR